jgi:microcystin-dependent protein
MDGCIGFVMPFAGNFAPANWFLCQGQQLAIAEYQALYSIIGAAFGGDGKTYFKLPDLRGRAVIGTALGSAGTSAYTVGQSGGSTSFTMNGNQLPSHVHLVSATLTPPASGGTGDQETPNGNVYAVPSLSDSIYSNNSTGRMLDFPGMVTMSDTGGGTPVQSQDPVLAINHIICYNGTYLVRP